MQYQAGQLRSAFTATSIRKVYMGKEDYLEDRRKIVQAYANWCDKEHMPVIN
jgi:hypothetical protein